MNKKDSAEALRRALASPLRLEVVGLFSSGEELSISDMAHMMGRPSTSLYHHVGILEKAGVLRVSGERPKGKRHEKLYAPSSERVELELEQNDEEARDQLAKVLRAAFRSATKDFETVLRTEELCTEGPERNLIAYRLHLRCGNDFLIRLNKQLDALASLLTEQTTAPREPSPDDKFLSLTLAMLPIPGRQAAPESKS